MGVEVTALWVQWVGIEVKLVGKMKLGDRKNFWHMQETKGWKKTVRWSRDLNWLQVKNGKLGKPGVAQEGDCYPQGSWCLHRQSYRY
jgi:hypothetical protein